MEHSRTHVLRVAAMRLLKDQTERVQAELWERQLEEYPDSVRRDFKYVLNVWLNRQMPETFRANREKEFAKMGSLYDSEDEFRREQNKHVSTCWQQERESIQRSVILTMQNTCGVFYECSLKPDGTYRYTGFRYGFEGSEYQSSIGDIFGDRI